MEALRRKRAGHRACATTVINAINTELAKPNPTLETIQGYATELERQRDTILELDEKVSDKIDADSLENDIKEASSVMIKISLCISKAFNFQKQHTNTSLEDRQSQAHANRSVKLPQLTLIKFSGEPLDWLNFWDLFRTSVHERQDLPAPVKFQYLVGQLEGEAARLIAGFNHTALEYEEAIDLIQETYGKEKILINARLNALLDIKPPEATVQSLSDFRSTYEGHLRVLKSLKLNVEDSGYVYAHILARKLPAATRDNINRAKKDDAVWNLDSLRSAINDEIKHLTSVNLRGAA